MLRYALRRIFWTVPVLFGVTLVLFAVLNLDRAQPTIAGSAQESAALPLFINPRPRDVRALSSDAVQRIASDSGDPAAAALVVRLGGAALPFVLPQLDSLDLAARERVAVALAPVAVRMGLASSDLQRTGPDAVTFWTLYWQERSVDFKPGVVHRAVSRLAAQGSETRRAELLELDTYALGDLMDALGDVQTPADVGRVSRLLDVASHVAGRDDRIGPDATLAQARACANRWREWWLASRADYELLSGPSRVAAMLVETRYGHWALRALTLKLGASRAGQPVLDRLVLRAPRTLLITGLGLLTAHVLGVALGLLSAWRRPRGLASSSAMLALLSLSVPVPAILMALARLTGGRWLLAVAIVAVAVVFAGSPLRHQRLAALEAWLREICRYARARGTTNMDLLLRHTLRPTVIAVLPLFAVDFPLAVSCTCAAEKALGLRGIGVHLVTAMLEHDISYLMAVGVAFTAIAAVLHMLADLMTAIVDARTRRHLMQERS